MLPPPPPSRNRRLCRWCCGDGGARGACCPPTDVSAASLAKSPKACSISRSSRSCRRGVRALLPPSRAVLPASLGRRRFSDDGALEPDTMLPGPLSSNGSLSSPPTPLTSKCRRKDPCSSSTLLSASAARRRAAARRFDSAPAVRRADSALASAAHTRRPASRLDSANDALSSLARPCSARQPSSSSLVASACCQPDNTIALDKVMV
jgi:hypothetical protein